MPGVLHSGVVPWLRLDDELRVVLITNRGGLWGFPKGLIERAFTPWDSAAKEAIEEAGVVGQVAQEPVTIYRHRKWVGTQDVAMYLMQVEDLLEQWEEDRLRDRTVLPIPSARAILRTELLPVLDWAASILERPGT